MGFEKKHEISGFAKTLKKGLMEDHEKIQASKEMEFDFLVVLKLFFFFYILLFFIPFVFFRLIKGLDVKVKFDEIFCLYGYSFSCLILVGVFNCRIFGILGLVFFFYGFVSFICLFCLNLFKIVEIESKMNKSVIVCCTVILSFSIFFVMKLLFLHNLPQFLFI